MNKSEVISVWQNADAVCFDVDSTVCMDEGIDTLAEFGNVGDKVKSWTNQAMGGSVTFQESFDARLKIINPTMSMIKSFIESHPAQLTPGVKDLIQKLKSRNCDVYLVSGGILELIAPVAEILNIDKNNIFANRLKYYFDGSYAGFDESSLTSRSGGKPEVMKLLKKKFNYQNLVMIGDGTTDLEAYPSADAFIGFGANVIRSRVKKEAQWFVTSFKELSDALVD